MSCDTGRPEGSRAGSNVSQRVAASHTIESTNGSPLVRRIRQPEMRPSGFTRNEMVALPWGMRPAEMRRYSLLGILPTSLAGVNRE